MVWCGGFILGAMTLHLLLGMSSLRYGYGSVTVYKILIEYSVFGSILYRYSVYEEM